MKNDNKSLWLFFLLTGGENIYGMIAPKKEKRLPGWEQTLMLIVLTPLVVLLWIDNFYG